MAITLLPRRRKSLTASVTTLTNEQRKKMTRTQPPRWQDAAWGFFHNVGEVQNSASYYASCLGRVRFFAGYRDAPADPLAPIPSDDRFAAEMEGTLARIRGHDGTFSALARQYGRQQFVAGESFLVGVDGLAGEMWEMLSSREYRKIEGKNLRFNADGASVELSADSIVLRLHQADPEFSHLAHSPMRAVLDICEALQVGQAMLTAGDRSVLASGGIWAIPAEADLPKVGDDTPGNPKRLALLDQIAEAAIMSMEDPGSVAAYAPILVEMKQAYIEAFNRGPVRFNREVDDRIVERLAFLVLRFAQGIDLPPEIVTGKANMNHWSAWSVSQDVISTHVGPLALGLGEDLTTGLIWPTLESMNVDRSEWFHYGIGADLTDLAVNPDRVADYLQAFREGAVNWEAVRRVIGANDEDAPEADELAIRAALGLFRGSGVVSDPNAGQPGDTQQGPPQQGDAGQPSGDGSSGSNGQGDGAPASILDYQFPGLTDLLDGYQKRREERDRNRAA